MTILKKLVAATAAAAAMTGASAASLIGQTVSYQYLFPDASTTYESSTFVVGSGVEVADMAGYLGSIDISANQIVITFAPSDSTFTSTAFNGIRLTSLTDAGAFDNVSVDSATSTPGFSSSFLSYSGNTLSINWEGMAFDTGETIVLDVSSVPESANAAMLLAGLGMMGVLARRRRAA